METRNPEEQGGSGMGEVHSHLSQPDKGVGMSGSTSEQEARAGYGDQTGLEQGAADRVADARERAGAVVDDAREHAEEALDQAREKVGELRDRAEEKVGEARTRANQAIDRAEQQLEERTGVISLIRENPLPALGVAVAVGYLAAGSRSRKRGRVMNMATRQLRAAIMGGVSAALMRELRSVASEQGGALASLFGEEGEGRSGSSGSWEPDAY
jgi:ElaB/YqjD/DUF883 family membrane-anchored ribosome-binding protein